MYARFRAVKELHRISEIEKKEAGEFLAMNEHEWTLHGHSTFLQSTEVTEAEMEGSTLVGNMQPITEGRAEVPMQEMRLTNSLFQQLPAVTGPDIFSVHAPRATPAEKQGTLSMWLLNGQAQLSWVDQAS